MRLFDGCWRKVSLLPLSTLLLGWIVYLVGFILLVVHGDTSSDHPRFDHLPHYIAVATPPVLVVLAALHAALSGLASSILGLFAAVLSVVSFSGVGYVLYTCAVGLYGSLHFNEGEQGTDLKNSLMFTGALLSSVSWMAVLVVWNYFTYKPQWATVHSLDEVVDEDGSLNSPPPATKDPPLFAGIARKVAAVFLLLKAASWCVLVTGVDRQVNENSSSYHVPQELVFPFDTWVVCVVGILLIFSALLHAASNDKASALMGALTSVLSQLFITGLGHLVFSISIDIYDRCQDAKECTVSATPKYQLYQLCGGVGAGILWACVLALWPFYFKLAETIRRRIQQRRQYYFQNRNHERMPLLHQSNEHDSPKPTAPY